MYSVINKQTGFSLIELGAVLAIMGIMLAIAIPAGGQWLQNEKIKSAAETLQTSLRQAKSLALSLNRNVRLSRVDTLDSSCSLDMNGQYLIISIGDPVGRCGDGVVNINSDLSTLATPIILEKVSLKQAGNIEYGGDTQLRFLSTGRLELQNAGAQMTRLYVYSASGAGECGYYRCLNVEVTRSGKVKICDPKIQGDAIGACQFPESNNNGE